MRDHYECVLCGNVAEEVHHKIWLTPSNINDTNITLNPLNLICLCRDCHMKQHRRQEIPEKYCFDANGMLVERKIVPPPSKYF